MASFERETLVNEHKRPKIPLGHRIVQAHNEPTSSLEVIGWKDVK